MSRHFFIDHLKLQGALTALIQGHAHLSYNELAVAVLHKKDELNKAGFSGEETVHINSGYSIDAFVLLIALLVNGNRVLLYQNDLPGNIRGFFSHSFSEARPKLPENLRSKKSSQNIEADGKLILATSGTSGIPKYPVLDFKRLFQGYIHSKSKPFKTVMALSFDHFGGVDVYLRALSAGGTVVLPQKIEPAIVFGLIQEHSADFLAATPSFFRLAILSGAVSQFNLSFLRRINLGAEKSSQTLVQKLCELFPQAEVRETFATTEAGVIAAKKATEDFTASENLKVENDQLLIKTQKAFVGYAFSESESPGPEEFIASGDAAAISEEGGIIVSGRKDRIINTGGEKVQPEKVEEALLHLTQIKDIQVYGEPHPMLGQLVCANVISRLGLEDLKKLIRQFGAKNLQPHEVPIKIQKVEEIPLTNRFKRKNPS